MNELLINNSFNLERSSFQLSTIHLVVLKTVLPALSRCYLKASGVTLIGLT